MVGKQDYTRFCSLSTKGTSVFHSSVHIRSLTLSNSANSSSSAGLTGSFRNRANSSMVIRPPLQELATAAKLSSSFLKLSHFRLREQGTCIIVNVLVCLAMTSKLFDRETFLLEFTADFGELNQAGLHGKRQLTR